jgi:hypothetical protein
MYTTNKKFFKQIDTEEKAYFLGLMYADGYVCDRDKSKYFVLSLQIADIHILEDFKKALNTDSKIRIIKKDNPKLSDTAILQLNGDGMVKDLINLGCFQAKSKILKFPREEQVPNELISHFIRGYFDGDGSIWNGKRKVMKVKEKESFRYRIIHNVKFNITGATDFITSLQNILIENLGFKKNKLNDSKKLGYCIQLEYSGRGQAEIFYNYLYENATVFFKRKKDKFEEIIHQRANI